MLLKLVLCHLGGDLPSGLREREMSHRGAYNAAPKMASVEAEPVRNALEQTKAEMKASTK